MASSWHIDLNDINETDIKFGNTKTILHTCGVNKIFSIL